MFRTPIERHRHFSAKDAQILEWFFTEGMCWFGSSRFGSHLEKASVFAGGSEGCRKCNTTGFVQVRVRVCEHCTDGYGNQEPPMVCRHCNGKRIIQMPDGLIIASRYGYLVPDVCPKCNGRGHYAKMKHLRTKLDEGGLTAKPRMAELHASPRSPDREELRWYGIVMKRLPYLSEETCNVLYAYWGVGAAYKSKKKYGRFWPVLALTPRGRQIVKRYRWARPKKLPERLYEWDSDYEFHKAWCDLTQPELFEELQELPGVYIKDGVWKQAMEEASELVEKAGKAWRYTEFRAPYDPPVMNGHNKSSNGKAPRTPVRDVVPFFRPKRMVIVENVPKSR